MLETSLIISVMMLNYVLSLKKNLKILNLSYFFGFVFGIVSLVHHKNFRFIISFVDLVPSFSSIEKIGIQ